MKYKSTSWDIEAAIQAELYVACKKAQLWCALEYLHEDCRFDLAVVEHNQVIAIIEVKTPAADSYSIERSTQIIKYRKYGIPVFILYSVYDIPYLVKRLIGVKTKFLESIEPAKIKCFEADRLSENKWDKKIFQALSKFDETFPDYKFTNKYSLEDIATGVKVLGLLDLLKLMDEYSKGSVGDFFFALNNLVNFRKAGPDHFLNQRKGTVQTATVYCNRQNRIDEKLK